MRKHHIMDSAAVRCLHQLLGHNVALRTDMQSSHQCQFHQKHYLVVPGSFDNATSFS